MIDTGASNTVIQAGLAQRLGLQPVGTQWVNTPTTQKPVQCSTYALRILMPKGVVANVTATESPLQGQNIHGLIGWDC